MHTIEVENLHKSYGNLPVLQGLSLKVQAGEIYGLLGPRGVGKTTFLHILLGFLKPSAGNVQLLGTSDVDTVHHRIGYLPEQLRYHLRFSPREYLYFLGKFSDMKSSTLRSRIDEELIRAGLADVANQKMATLTKGMIQRVGIVQALLNNPDLLLIDEPTSGLDPAFRYDILDMLSRVRSQGHTILLCTRQLDEIEHLCDRAGILVEGTIQTEVHVKEMRGIGTHVNIQVKYLPPELQGYLNHISSAVHCTEYGITLQPNNQSLQSSVLRTLLDANIEILSLESLERPLEEIYLRTIRRRTQNKQEHKDDDLNGKE